jgi:signal transduction histidine kinase/CheY-like chemotaxis protein
MWMSKAIKRSTAGFGSELRISAWPVVAMLAVTGLALVFVGEVQSGPSARLEAQRFALLSYALAAVAWLLGSWNPALGKGFVVFALVAVVALANRWSGVPGFLTFMVIPTALAAALLSLLAATVTAVGQTALLVLLPGYVAPGASPAAVAVAVVAIWATLGVMCAVYYHVYQLSRWLWAYFQRAQGALEEERDRKAELGQALDDLAHANRQLTLINERLVALRLIAEEAQKTKAAFVAKVSHEFRTPLNMIIGLIDLLVETPEVYGQDLPPALFEDLKIVHRNCEHLSSMINDVLDLSQAEAGRLTLHREHVDLAAIVEEALTVVRPLLEKKGLGLQVVVPHKLPEIYCDRTRIRQVILNLVSNAARFTEEGGISVRVVEQARHVVVSVTDTGPGISPENAKGIFEPFYQGTGSPWRDKGGSGLGLSISKQFVELHGGRIWLESEPGAGTTFSFDLPISSPVPRVTRPDRWIKEDWIWVERTSRARLPDSHYKPRVVLCDRTGDLYPAFGRCSDEVEFVEARSLAQAVQALRQCPAHALVINAERPEDLWPLAREARSEMPDTPVIGCSVPPQFEQALQAGAIDYMIKPVTRAALEAAIQAAGRPVKRVLAVDDDPDVLQLWTRMLHACNGQIEVVPASSGAQSLEKLRSEPLDLVLLDIVMPDMDGWQVMECKRRDEAIRDVPVILISAQDPLERQRRSQVFLATMGEGLSISQLLRCSLELSSFLLQPGGGPDRAPG